MSSLILGCMTFGWKDSSEAIADEAALQQIENFVSHGYTELDTALIYADGETERIMGRVLAANPELRSKVKIATKANPYYDPNAKNISINNLAALKPNGGLRFELVKEQLNESLISLQVPSVDIFYLHMPDTTIPLIESLRACNELYKEGKFKQLGLSNYSAWETVHAYHLCEKNGWVKPTVYQGMYNPYVREVEKELIPALKTLGIRFVCYNPLAGGILTGKHTRMDVLVDGRFKENKAYQNRFWKPSYFAATDLLRPLCEKYNISMVQVAFSWLLHHSALSKEQNDGVILGCSSIAQLEANVKACKGGALPDEILEALNKGWELCKADCPKYFRP